MKGVLKRSMTEIVLSSQGNGVDCATSFSTTSVARTYRGPRSAASFAGTKPSSLLATSLRSNGAQSAAVQVSATKSPLAFCERDPLVMVATIETDAAACEVLGFVRSNVNSTPPTEPVTTSWNSRRPPVLVQTPVVSS
eukprot:2778804-Rhodomonas_salina.3